MDSFKNTIISNGILATFSKSDRAHLINNKIYIFDSDREKQSNQSYMINPPEDEKTGRVELEPFNIPRKYHTIESVSDKIYVIGGYDGIVNYNDIYIYNTQMNIWTNGKDFQNNNKSYSVVILNDELYIIFEDTIDNGKKLRYDNGLNEWLFS